MPMPRPTSSFVSAVRRIVTTVCVCGLLPTIAAAHPILIDQAHPYAGGGTVFLVTNNLGQTFTPTLNSLEAVELWLMDTQPFNGFGSTLSVRIFELDGTLLGSSAPQFFGDLYGGAYRC